MLKLSNKLKFLFQILKTGTVIGRRLGGLGLGIGDLAVLHAISNTPEGKIRPTDLAEAVGLTASGVTRLLLPLEKIGVVKREAHERDGRVSFVVMTKSGEKLYEDAIRWLELKINDAIPDDQTKNLTEASKLLEMITK